MHRESARILVMAFVFASACAAGPQNPEPSTPTLAPPGFLTTQAIPPVPELDPGRVAAGEALYQEHCASCHQADLSGETDWQIPKDDGTYKAPPHDSTGHTWHHSDRFFLEIVRDGNPDPIATMPTFGDRLSDEDITSILEFLKSHWGPDERAVQWQVTWREGA